MTDATDAERKTIYAVYLAARERPHPLEYATLRTLLPGADEATIDEAADAATIGAIHGATGQPALGPDALTARLAAKDRDMFDAS